MTDPSCTCAPALLCDSLSEFVSCHAHGVDQSLGALKLLWGVHTSTQSEGASLVVIRCIAACCRDSRPQLQDHSFVLLQAVLMDKRASGLPPTAWQAAFDSVLFPLLGEVADQRAADTDGRRDDAAASSAVRSALPIELGKVFSLRAGNLVRLPRFHETWVAYLKLLEKFAGLTEEVVPHCDVVLAFGESMGRLRQLGVFKAGDESVGKEIEDLTWAIIGEMRADICGEFRRVGKLKHDSSAAT